MVSAEETVECSINMAAGLLAMLLQQEAAQVSFKNRWDGWTSATLGQTFDRSQHLSCCHFGDANLDRLLLYLGRSGYPSERGWDRDVESVHEIDHGAGGLDRRLQDPLHRLYELYRYGSVRGVRHVFKIA